MQTKAMGLKAPKSSIRESKGSRAVDIINYVLLTIVALVCLLPFLHVEIRLGL